MQALPVNQVFTPEDLRSHQHFTFAHPVAYHHLSGLHLLNYFWIWPHHPRQDTIISSSHCHGLPEFIPAP